MLDSLLSVYKQLLHLRLLQLDLLDLQLVSLAHLLNLFQMLALERLDLLQLA